MPPLLYIDESLKEIDYAFGTLKTDGGGVPTSVAERPRMQMARGPSYKGKVTRDMVDHELRRVYYDTAQVANEVTILALAKLVPISQIVLGTDYPCRDGPEHVTGLAERFDARDLKAIDRDNAPRFLPAWR